MNIIVGREFFSIAQRWRVSPLVATLILVVGLGLFGCSSSYEEKLDQGDQCLLDQKPVCAFNRYSEAIEDRPDDPEAYLRRAVVHETLGRDTEAKTDIQIARGHDPAPNDWYQAAWFFDHSAEKPSRAIWAYSQAIKKHPEFGEAFHNRAVLHENLGHEEKAIKDYKASLRHRPDQWQGYANLGSLYRENGNFSESVTMYTKAIENHPDDTGLAELHIERGFTSLQMGNTQSARSQVEKALDYDSETTDLLHVRSLIAWVDGDLERAQKDLRQALERDPGNTVLLTSLCGLLVDRSQIQKAIEQCSRSISHDSSMPYAYYKRAQAYRQEGKLKKALQDARRAVKLHPPSEPYEYIRPLWDQPPGEAYRSLRDELEEEIQT